MKTIYMAGCMLLSGVGLAQTSAPLSNNPPGTIVAQLQPDGARPSRPQQPDPVTSPSRPQQLTYSFTVTNAAEYAIEALVRTPGPGATSILVNIDHQPQEPKMLWDVPPTTNFQSLFVTWRGTNAQPEHKYFSVAPGDHVLFFQPRSPGVQLQTVTLQPRPEPPAGSPPPPTNFHIVDH